MQTDTKTANKTSLQFIMKDRQDSSLSVWDVLWWYYFYFSVSKQHLSFPVPRRPVLIIVLLSPLLRSFNTMLCTTGTGTTNQLSRSITEQSRVRRGGEPGSAGSNYDKTLGVWSRSRVSGAHVQSYHSLSLPFLYHLLPGSFWEEMARWSAPIVSRMIESRDTIHHWHNYHFSQCTL